MTKETAKILKDLKDRARAENWSKHRLKSERGKILSRIAKSNQK